MGSTIKVPARGEPAECRRPRPGSAARVVASSGSVAAWAQVRGSADPAPPPRRSRAGSEGRWAADSPAARSQPAPRWSRRRHEARAAGRAVRPARRGSLRRSWRSPRAPSRARSRRHRGRSRRPTRVLSALSTNAVQPWSPAEGGDGSARGSRPVRASCSRGANPSGARMSGGASCAARPEQALHGRDGLERVVATAFPPRRVYTSVRAALRTRDRFESSASRSTERDKEETHGSGLRRIVGEGRDRRDYDPTASRSR